MPSNLAEALRYHQAGKLLLAEKKYQEVLQEEPDNADALHLLGVLYQQAGFPDKAISLITQAIKLCGEASHFHNNLGNVYAELNRFNEAITCYLLAIKMQPNFAQAHFNLGNSYKETNRRGQAIEAYQESLIHDPVNSNVMKNMGLVYSAMYNYDAAIQTLNEALILQPDDYQLINNLANLNVKLGAFDKAQDNFDRALTYNDRDPTLRYNQALLHFMETSIKDWVLLIDDYMTKADRHLPYDYEMEVRATMSYWAAGNDALLKVSLDKCRSLFVQLGTTPDRNCMNMHSYENYIVAMMRDVPDRLSLNSGSLSIACVGDSHSLSYAHLGVPHIELIVGCKAWHLAQNNDKQYRTAFEKAVKRLPKGSSCILSFGEIDCRVDEGFCKFYKKHGNDLTTQIKECVEAYVNYTTEVLEKHSVKAVYLNVPAPYLSALKMSPEDAYLVQQVIGTYNDALSEVVKTHEACLINLYDFTNSGSLSADGQKHSDAYHLKPSIELMRLMTDVLELKA